MDYETYKKNYYVDPPPEPRFHFAGAWGATLYYEDYQKALDFYGEVLGPPAYIEGENTHGWRIGETWLTLFPSKKGNPQNIEVPFFVETPEEVDRLYEALIAAGAQGEPPVDTLMYHPVRACYLKDPFGVELMVACWLGEENEYTR
jgi:uncharacterized glyoxalase superfamily protein PhnB